MKKRLLPLCLLLCMFLSCIPARAENTQDARGRVPLDTSNFFDYFSCTPSVSTSPMDYRSENFNAKYELILSPLENILPEELCISLSMGTMTFTGTPDEDGMFRFTHTVTLRAKDYSGVSAYMQAITTAATEAMAWKNQSPQLLQAEGFVSMPAVLAEALNEKDYQQALSLYQENRIEEALVLLDRLARAPYRDSGEIAAQYRNARHNQYLEAREAMNTQSYKLAHKLFSGLEDYEDAPALAKEALYRLGEQLMNQGQLIDALAILENMPGYADTDTLILKTHYLLADDMLSQGQYDDAIAAFLLLSDFGDAPEKIRTAYLLSAQQAMDEKRWEDAIRAFENAEAGDRISTVYQAMGDEALEKGQFDQARTAYEKAQNPDKIKHLNEKIAQKAEQEGRWQDAIAAYEQTPAPDQAPEGILRCRYALAEEMMEKGLWEEAVEVFRALGDYQDAPRQISSAYYRMAEACTAQGNYWQAQALYRQAGNFQDAAQMARAMSRSQADAFAAKGEYEQAYLLYQSIWDDEIQGLIQENEALKQARKDWQKSVKKGETISFGFYEADGNPANGPEKLEWLVLTVTDSNKALLLCVSQPAMQKFMQSKVYVTWKHSDLRTWLNDSFLHTAFSSFQQSAILETQVKAVKEDHTEVTPGNHAADRLFCLNLTEYNQYIAKEKKIAAALADCHLPLWWLRSPGKSMGMILTVQPDGTTLDKRADLNFTVCPAMWIDLKSELFH